MLYLLEWTLPYCRMATRRQHDTKGVYIKIRRTHKICRPHNEHMLGQVLSETYHVAYASATLLYAELTLRQLMLYTYGAPILDVSRSHTTTHHGR